MKPPAPHRSRLSRRAFLLTAGALTAVAAGLTAGQRSRGYALPASLAGKLQVLRPADALVMLAAARRLLPPGAEPDVVAMDGALARLATWQQSDLRTMLRYLEQLAPLSLGLASRFSHQAAADQDRILAALEASRFDALRAGFQGLKGLAFMSHYRRPDTWRALGYSGPTVQRSP